MYSRLRFWIFDLSDDISHRKDHSLMEQKLFVALIGTDALIIVLDTFMWALDGTSGILFRAVYLFATACYYSLNPLICAIWLFYVDYQIYRSVRHLKRLMKLSAIPLSLNGLLAFTSIFTAPCIT
jgi:hypothetical protein